MSELILVKDSKNPNLHRVMYKGGGTRPDALDGLWSRKGGAKAIEEYKNRPMPTPIEYKGAKKITDEEEADLFEKVKLEVEAKNNGKEEHKKTKDANRTKRVHKGTDNRS